VLSNIVVANLALPGAIVSTPCGDDETITITAKTRINFMVASSSE